MSAPWIDHMLDRLDGVLDREARVARSSATPTNSTNIKRYVQAVIKRVALEHALSVTTMEARGARLYLTGGNLAEATSILAHLGISPDGKVTL